MSIKINNKIVGCTENGELVDGVTVLTKEDEEEFKLLQEEFTVPIYTHRGFVYYVEDNAAIIVTTLPSLNHRRILFVPAKLNEYPVGEIEICALSGLKAERIVFFGGRIDEEAIFDCPNLERVHVKDGCIWDRLVCGWCPKLKYDERDECGRKAIKNPRKG